MRLLGGDGGVSGDHLGHDSSKGFDTEGERSNVEEKQVFHVALKDAALDGGSDSYSLIGVD